MLGFGVHRLLRRRIATHIIYGNMILQQKKNESNKNIYVYVCGRVNPDLLEPVNPIIVLSRRGGIGL